MSRRFYDTPRAPFLLAPCLAFGAVGAVHYSDLPGQSVIAMVFNIALAVPAFLGLRQANGVTRWLITLLVLSLFAFAIESVAVATGVPYGRFSYGADLGPKLLGLVPITLPFSWIPIVLGSRVWATAILGPARRVQTLLLSTGLMVAFDLVLDPGAAALHYWTWQSAGAYYGIPESNFVGWVISSLIAQGLLTLLTRSAAMPWFTTYSLVWGLFFWTCVAALSGWLALTLWALLLLTWWLLTHQKASAGEPNNRKAGVP